MGGKIGTLLNVRDPRLGYRIFNDIHDSNLPQILINNIYKKKTTRSYASKLGSSGSTLEKKKSVIDTPGTDIGSIFHG